jgi:hypothetical protein
MNKRVGDGQGIDGLVRDHGDAGARPHSLAWRETERDEIRRSRLALERRLLVRRP